MIHKKVQIKFFIKDGKVLDRKTEISFNGKPIMAQVSVDNLNKPEKFELEFHRYNFFLSNERIDIEEKLCVVIPPIQTTDYTMWHPHNFAFYYAEEWLTIKSFDLFYDNGNPRLVVTISRNFIELITEDLSDASTATI